MTPEPSAVDKQAIGSNAFKRPRFLDARRLMIAGMLGLMLITGIMTWLTLSRIKTIERSDLQNTLENILLICI